MSNFGDPRFSECNFCSMKNGAANEYFQLIFQSSQILTYQLLSAIDFQLVTCKGIESLSVTISSETGKLEWPCLTYVCSSSCILHPFTLILRDLEICRHCRLTFDTQRKQVLSKNRENE